MSSILIRNARIVNEGKIYHADVFIVNQRIEKIDTNGIAMAADRIIDASGMYLLPGCIDDQVHFREPGLTHKANIHTESKAAVAGGITSFMEMPNTLPPATTIALMEEKYARAAETSVANYSFYLGASNDNYHELTQIDPEHVCGIKVFLGSSTGNLLVDNEDSIRKLFSITHVPIAAHCEDDGLIKQNAQAWKNEHGDIADAGIHPIIRNAEACYRSSSKAIALARETGARLHVLHISTAQELDLFDIDIPLAQKRITAEACVHHLWFNDSDYAQKGNFIKWNPSVKSKQDQDAILKAVNDGRIDVIATDHAPHTLEEKNQDYWNAPSGGPLVQHALLALLEMHQLGKISLETIVQKTAHNPAILFDIDRRGFIREGFYADLVLVSPIEKTLVTRDSVLSKCGWSPFEGTTFSNKIAMTIVSGQIVYENNQVNDSVRGMRLRFMR